MPLIWLFNARFQNKSTEILYAVTMRVVKPSKLTMQGPQSDGMLFVELDMPEGQSCFETEEFNLIQNMLTAAVEERYLDAAQWRDQLHQLRSRRKNRT
ncbi:bifunctional nuclease 2-like [Musa acuminata AAA Group]|uniref:bifunctional nuclease 2-like n=1 Tax=Musa acuminata AAA Group TaxID=214697 RepID=UPI0031E1521A